MKSIAASVRYRFGRFEVQPDERRLLADGEPVHLGPHAFDLLVALVERAGRLVTKDELLALVWPRVVVEENTLQAHVSALRKVLGRAVIGTVSGHGYRFGLDVVRFDVEAARADAAPANNLPHEFTTFIGRERQLAQIKELLGSARLLTLTGAGGCGKTRLALRVAREVLADYGDGAWLVELAPLGDPTLLTRTVAIALSVEEKADQDPEQTLVEWIGSKRLLLVLDNAEHLLDACAALADRLLRLCPQLTIVVTSRQRLGILGELTYRVPSLSMPDSDATVDELRACEAARLFIDRARLQRPDQDFAAQDARALASICRRLDGIALAIELAAARTRAMSWVELSDHLDDRFDLLTGGSRTALARHRTLRSLIDWSHDLLDETEKTMLRRVSVFAGGWTGEAAEAVCAGSGIERHQVLDLLGSLADKCFLVVDVRADATRFDMLETVRHYAQLRLRESKENEEPQVRDRLVDYVLDKAAAIDAIQGDAERAARMRALDGELDNVRAALAWCEATPARADRGLRIAGELLWFWRTRGHTGEALRWIRRLMAVAPAGPPTQSYARALHTAASMAFIHADYATSEAQYREVVAIARSMGDQRQVARSLLGLANTVERYDKQTALDYFKESVTLARAVGDRFGVVVGMNCVALVAYDIGDYATAGTTLEECLPLAREVGAHATAGVLMLFGDIRHAQGRFEEARALLSESVEGHRQFGHREAIGATLLRLAIAVQDCGDVSGAITHLAEALELLRHTSDNYVAAWLETYAAAVAATAGPTYSARLWGCAQRIREELGTTLATPSVRGRQERLIAAARRSLADDAAFDAAWAEGRTWSCDHALQYATDRMPKA